MLTAFVLLSKAGVSYSQSPPGGLSDEPSGLPEGLPAEQITKTDQEIFLQTQSELGDANSFLVVLVMAGVTVTLAAVGGWYYLKRKGKVAEVAGVDKEEKEPSADDQKRKEDLDRIRVALSAFYKLRDRYPAEDEFRDIRESIEDSPQDPREGKARPGTPGQFFGYFYDQRKYGIKEPDPRYYRLWCFLEDGKRYQLTSDDKKEEPEEKPLDQAVEHEEVEPEGIEKVTPRPQPSLTQPQIVEQPVRATTIWRHSDSLTLFLIATFTIINLGLLLVNLYLSYQMGNLRSEILNTRNRVETIK